MTRMVTGIQDKKNEELEEVNHLAENNQVS